MRSVTASPQPTDTQVARQNPTPLREARPLTQQLWFLTKGGITSLYHTGHFTQAISVARSYTAHSANAVPNEGWHYFIIPHRTFYPCFYTADSTNVVQNEGRRYLIIPHRTFTEVTSVARSYTADSAHAVPNEGWHYLIKPHRALYPGYISGKILHC